MDDQVKAIQIEEPSLLTRAARVRDKILTALMWVAYSLLWLPLLTFGAWLFGVERAYEEMVLLGGASTLELTLADWLYALAILLATIVAWSLLNRARFATQIRRTQGVSVSDIDVCEWFRISEAELVVMRSSKSMAVDFNEAGRPVVRRPELWIGAPVTNGESDEAGRQHDGDSLQSPRIRVSGYGSG